MSLDLAPRLCRGWMVVVVLIVGAQAGRAASFSAELVATERGETRSSPFAFADGSYRFELVDQGEAMVLLRDGASGVMRLLRPSLKQFVEAGPDEPLSRMADLFGCYAYYARTVEVHARGPEPIDGVPCVKQELWRNGQLILTAWYSEELRFPLKVDMPLFAQVVELRRVARGPQDAGQFALPEGFTPAPPEDTQPPPPEWAAKAGAAPEANAPFERTLMAGAMLRVKPRAGQHLRLEVTAAGADSCTFVGIAFKGGRPIGRPGPETVTLEPGGSVTITLTKGPDAAEDLVLRCSAGQARVKAAWISAAASEQEAARADPAVTLTAPATAPIASRIEVAWSGPGANGDFIAVARPDQPPGANLGNTRVKDLAPIQLWAPSDPGDYEIRYVQARPQKVLARIPITIEAVPASVRTDPSARVADWISVTWDGPAADRDFIGVARPGSRSGVNEATVRVSGGNPARLRAPSDPGVFEIRYVLGRGERLLASCPITIEAVSASVEPPAKAVAGAEFRVAWTGPGYPEDFISIAKVGQLPGAHVGSRATRMGNPVTLRAPKEPGVYEVRYILGRGSRQLASATITVEAP